MHTKQSPTSGLTRVAPRSGPGPGVPLFVPKNTLILLVLIILTVATFWPVTNHRFLDWDDGQYVFDNPVVKSGLTAAGLRWAFTADTDGMWHPLTMISHMLDVELFGLNAGGHHLTNLILHAFNTALLFLVLLASTSRVWPAAFTAALFAIHPLHVESVAWVSERKDVLAGCFWFLGMLTYLRYLRRPSVRAYAGLLFVFALGLMSKLMLVSLPLVLLVLDYWPLGRFVPGDWRRRSRQLIVEKIPLLVLAAGAALLTIRAGLRGDHVMKLIVIPLGERLANAPISCLLYIWKMLYPVSLSFLYPYPLAMPPLWLSLGAALLLTGITVVVSLAARRRPYLLAGWLWFVVSLAPVIGIVQIGVHALADRYTYLPLIGLFMAGSWAAAAVSTTRERRGAALLGAAAIIALLAVAANAQVAYWKDNVALFGHGVAADPDNWIAQNNLGKALALEGRFTEAMVHFAASVHANPNYEPAWYNHGAALLREGNLKEAAEDFRKALALEPDYAEAHDNLGLCLLRQGRPREAVGHLEEARRLNPRDPEPLCDLGWAWFALGDPAQAEHYAREAMLLKPDYAEAAFLLEAIHRQGLTRQRE